MAWSAPGAGELRDRVTIERHSLISNGAGDFTDVWTVIAEDLPAKIVTIRGGEAVRALRLSGTTPLDVTLRASTLTKTITAADRALNARTGERLNIKWVGTLEEGRKTFVTLTCVAGEVVHG